MYNNNAPRDNDRERERDIKILNAERGGREGKKNDNENLLANF